MKQLFFFMICTFGFGFFSTINSFESGLDKFAINDSFYDSSDFKSNKINFKLSYLNSHIDPMQKFLDNNLKIKYLKFDSYNSSIKYGYSFKIENEKKTPQYEFTEYYGKDINGFYFELEKSFLIYKNKFISLKLGRDNLNLGKKTRNRILFSNKGLPYDHIFLNLTKNNFTISTYYATLDMQQVNQDKYHRHLNGHRFEYRFNKGYFAVNELAIYGGISKSFHYPLLNPLNSFYIYQYNNRFNLNSVFSFEYFFSNENDYFFIEFIIDDFQIHKNKPSDLEPPELGLLLEFSKKISQKININIDYLIISNRTFNARFFDYEKMIYKNFPIGNILGNNFWKVESSIQFIQNKYNVDLRAVFVERGEEALFSDFNTDYLNFDIDQGYSEKFPFGESSIMSGLIVDFNVLLSGKTNLTPSIAYWFDSFSDKEGFNFGVSMEHDFNLSN